MSRLEKIIVFVLLVLAVVISGWSLLEIRQEHKALQEEPTTDDSIGQVYYSCSLDGLAIGKEEWRNAMRERGLTDKAVLVVWHSSLGCKTCNAFVLEKTQKIQETGLPVLIVGADYRMAPSTEMELYLGPNESLGLSAEDLKIPFLFIYDGVIRHLYFPDIRNEVAFDMYLDVISMRYGSE